jgi:PqqD family protein of HPr-rel-A system
VQRWSVASDLTWTNYPDSDEWVVYNPVSADLHLLTSSARKLWTLIAAGGGTSLEEMAEHLAAALGRPVDGEVQDATREAIASMDRVGLVRPVGGPTGPTEQ